MSDQKVSSVFEAEMNRQIEERIAEIERPGYDCGKPFSKTDWLLAGLIVAVGLAITIAGLF